MKAFSLSNNGMCLFKLDILYQVERDFMGNILPVIVADKDICSELRTLEEELDSTLSWQSGQSGNSSPDESRVNTEAEAMNFLHELGWIFQSTSQGFYRSAGLDGDASHISLSRFEGLLKYAVLRDWCAVVKKLLDLLFFIGIKETAEVLHVLSEVNLLHQAVKRKCRPMIELLLQFVPDKDESRSHKIFTPVVEGPAGFTPLHIAASMFGAEDIIDALTEDPTEVMRWSNDSTFSSSFFFHVVYVHESQWLSYGFANNKHGLLMRGQHTSG